jgi:hypothetical protein
MAWNNLYWVLINKQNLTKLIETLTRCAFDLIKLNGTIIRPNDDRNKDNGPKQLK